MKKKYLTFYLLIFTFKAYALHDESVCIAVYPTPPECLHIIDNKDKNDVLIASVVVIILGTYFYLNKDKNKESKFFEKNVFISNKKIIKLSFFTQRENLLEKYSYKKTKNLFDKDFDNSLNHNFLTIDLSALMYEH